MKHCGKRRNCLYKQFLLFQHCFQKASFPEVSQGVIVWEWIKGGPSDLGTKKLTKILKSQPYTPKAFDFHS